MRTIYCALLADGASDESLLPILKWIMEQHFPEYNVQVDWADLWRMRVRPDTLTQRICGTAELHPGDVLFVHRDAESQPPSQRHDEIHQAVGEAGQRGMSIPCVCVVPVRMTEAWLLLDESAIRRAAGNPNGSMPLSLPASDRIESLPDPKAILWESLRIASGLHGRRIKTFREFEKAKNVSGAMNGFACLRALPSFQRLEVEVCSLADRFRQRN